MTASFADATFENAWNRAKEFKTSYYAMPLCTEGW